MIVLVKCYFLELASVPELGLCTLNILDRPSLDNLDFGAVVGIWQKGRLCSQEAASSKGRIRFIRLKSHILKMVASARTSQNAEKWKNTLESPINTIRTRITRLPKGHHKAFTRLPIGHPKVTKRAPQGYQKSITRLPKGHHKAI